MRHLTGSILFSLLVSSVVSADGSCPSGVQGYRVVPNSMFEFSQDGRKECFFAFYTENVNKHSGASGVGNEGDAVWYAHLGPNNSVQEFAKPTDFEPEDWQDICRVDAVSFMDINGDGLRDVTVIGACGTPIYRSPFVFLRKKDDYVLDVKTLFAFSGHNLITISDVKKFFKTGELPK